MIPDVMGKGEKVDGHLPRFPHCPGKAVLRRPPGGRGGGEGHGYSLNIRGGPVLINRLVSRPHPITGV